VRIRIVTPEPPRARRGNSVTAARWARLLRELGHDVRLAGDWHGESCELLIALHAARSASAIARFHQARPQAPLILALTGTDVYRDLAASAAARRSLQVASRIVVLQPLATAALDGDARRKARVIYQSVVPPPASAARSREGFDVLLLAHVRPVKDPLVVVQAARQLPTRSRLRVIHYGGVADAALAQRLAAEAAEVPRYHWRGEVPRWRALRALARAHALIVPSRLEGGANVVSEALMCGVPILASRIAGSVGVLGEDHPGYFPVGDHRALAELLVRAEREPAFLAALRARSAALRPLVEPARERAAWSALLDEL